MKMKGKLTAVLKALNSQEWNIDTAMINPKTKANQISKLFKLCSKMAILPFYVCDLSEKKQNFIKNDSVLSLLWL